MINPAQIVAKCNLLNFLSQHRACTLFVAIEGKPNDLWRMDHCCTHNETSILHIKKTDKPGDVYEENPSI